MHPPEHNLTSILLPTAIAASDSQFIPTSTETELGWENVAIALAFILFNTFLSGVLRIGVGTSLLVSAVRCILQLTVVATILQQVFAAEDKWVVAGISCKWPSTLPLWSHSYTLVLVLLNLLGTIEIGMSIP